MTTRVHQVILNKKADKTISHSLEICVIFFADFGDWFLFNH